MNQLGDYHGQLGLDVYTRDTNRLLHILRLVLERQSPDNEMFTGFATICAEIGPSTISSKLGEGPEWLVLWTWEKAKRQDGGEIHPFVVPFTADDAAEYLGRWVTLKDPDHSEPGIDGTVEAGAFHAISGWQVEQMFGVGASIAIRRVWAVYGK